jgi:ribosomal protein S18 acetylase RimI-like enzyme
MRVWQAQPNDLEAVTGLMAGFRDSMDRDAPGDELIRATVARLLDDPQTEFLLAAAGEERSAAAVCQLRYRLSVWTGAGDCWLEDLFVEERVRGSGLGRALVEAAFARAGERDCRRIQLDVAETNTPALRLYERLGFGVEPGPAGRSLFISRRLP